MRNFILSPNFKNLVKASFLSFTILIASLSFGCLNASAKFDDEFPPFEANSQNNEEADSSETNNFHRPLSINPTGHFESEFNMDAEKLYDKYNIVIFNDSPDHKHQVQKYIVDWDNAYNPDKCTFLDVDTTVNPTFRNAYTVIEPNSENAKELYSEEEFKNTLTKLGIRSDSLKFVMFPDHK